MEKKRGRPRVGVKRSFRIEPYAYELFKSRVKVPSEKIRELVKEFTVKELIFSNQGNEEIARELLREMRKS